MEENLEPQENENQENLEAKYIENDKFYIVAYAPSESEENPYQKFVKEAQEETGVPNLEYTHLFAYTTSQIYDRSGSFSKDGEKIEDVYEYIKENYKGNLKVFKFDSGILVRNFKEFIQKMNMPLYPGALTQPPVEDVSDEYPTLEDTFYGQQYATSFLLSKALNRKVVKPLIKKEIPKERILSEFLDNGTNHTSKPIPTYSSQSLMRLFPKEVSRFFMFPGAAVQWLEIISNKYKKDVEILDWENTEGNEVLDEPTPIYKGDPYKEAGYTLAQVFLNTKK